MVTDDGIRVAGYIRVSTNKQEIGPEVQVAELEREAVLRGWELTLFREDAVSAATVSKRPVLLGLLDDLKEHRFDALAVSKLDRLSRNTEDGSRLLAEAQRQGWRIMCLDLGVDTGTIMGAAMFNMALNFAEVERKFIGQRTKAAMARVKEVKHVGRPRLLPVEVTERIVSLREEGVYLKDIAAALNDDGVPTAMGTGPWTIAKVQTALNTRTARNVYMDVAS